MGVGGPDGAQDLVGTPRPTYYMLCQIKNKKVIHSNIYATTTYGVGGPARAQDVVARRAVTFLQQCVFYTPLKISCKKTHFGRFNAFIIP